MSKPSVLRGHVINEIVATEKEYLNDISLLCDIYMRHP